MIVTTYPPLDKLKNLAPNLWIVDSGPLRVFGMPLPVRMTVVRLASGDVWLHSPTRYDDNLRREIEAVGPIRHLVAPNVAHWTFLKEWQDHCPDALTWAHPNLRKRRQVRRSGLRIDRDLGHTAPAAWSQDLQQVVVAGGFGFREVAFLHGPSRTVILTDLVVNLEPAKLPRLMRPFARFAGITVPNGRAPIYLRFIIRIRRRMAARARDTLLKTQPGRVVFTHGLLFYRDGAAQLRRSLRWLGKS